jgi:formate dehydrogenase iron-sulfur subunit
MSDTGFFTDATLCIGCKACEVACKQWNELPSDGFEFTGDSYDNTSQLSGTTWRHVGFVEQMGVDANGTLGDRWLMFSDVCKHCTNAGCHEACPTGAIVRNEFGNVYVQPDVCNGCGYCVVSCPFGVIDLIENIDGSRQYNVATLNEDRRDANETAVQGRGGVAGKCTLCYDRQKSGIVPACAKACPTESIQFGNVAELRERAHARVETLRDRGIEATLYGADDIGGGIGALNAFFLLTDKPETYNLPAKPVLPSTRQPAGYASAAIAAFGLALAGWAIFRSDRA